MNEFKNKDDIFISNDEKILLNKNNTQFKSNPTYQNIYQNPLRIQRKTNNKPNNPNFFIDYSSDKGANQNNFKNDLNITPIEPEMIQLNNTFPNQQAIELGLYNNSRDKKNKSYNIIENNSLNDIKNEIIKDYKSIDNDNDEQLNELALNIKENENKINQITKTMNLIINKNTNDDIINTKSIFNQINDIEKIQQENITLKADSIILREDISNLVKLNDKYTQDLEIARKKIMELIDRNNGLEKEINHKEYQKEKLNEILTRLRLYENQDVEYKIRNNKTKEEALHEIEYNIKMRKDENNKLINEKKILEEKIKFLIENKNDNNRNNIINNERENKIISELEEKIQILEKGMKDLNEENNILNINNTKMEKELKNLYEDKNNYENNYNKIKEKFDILQFQFDNLYKKYQHMLFENNKRLVKKENIKRNKSEKKLKNNKSIINELYNKIQMLKTKVKKERNMEN